MTDTNNQQAKPAAAQGSVAWMTHHDEPMLYPTFAEAAAYCYDDEPPIPLYAAPVAAAPVDSLIAEMRNFADVSDSCQITEGNAGAALKAASEEGHDSAIRYVLGYLNGTGDCGSTMYEEILKACGRARIIESAIADSELEFTGLERYVKKYGTATEKRKVRAALRKQATRAEGDR